MVINGHRLGVYSDRHELEVAAAAAAAAAAWGYLDS